MAAPALDFVSYVLALEELVAADAGVGRHGGGAYDALRRCRSSHSAPTARRSASCPRCRGETIGAFALTEADTGSDAGALRTTAPADETAASHRHQDSGSRTAATRGRRPSSPGPTADQAAGRECRRSCVGREQPRLTREEEKLGLNSSPPPTCLDGRAVPADRARHEEEAASRSRWRTLDGGRIGIAAQAVGIAQAPSTAPRAYCQGAHQFGKPIADFQAIQFKLADMATEIDAARAAHLQAAALKDAGARTRSRARKAKLFASEWPAARPPRRSRSSAATATPRSSRSSATTATPRSPRSTRARARCSGIVIARSILAHADGAVGE